MPPLDPFNTRISGKDQMRVPMVPTSAPSAPQAPAMGGGRMGYMPDFQSAFAPGGPMGQGANSPFAAMPSPGMPGGAQSMMPPMPHMRAQGGPMNLVGGQGQQGGGLLQRILSAMQQNGRGFGAPGGSPFGGGMGGILQSLFQRQASGSPMDIRPTSMGGSPSPMPHYGSSQGGASGPTYMGASPTASGGPNYNINTSPTGQKSYTTASGKTYVTYTPPSQSSGTSSPTPQPTYRPGSLY